MLDENLQDNEGKGSEPQSGGGAPAPVPTIGRVVVLHSIFEGDIPAIVISADPETGICKLATFGDQYGVHHGVPQGPANEKQSTWSWPARA